MKGSSEDGSGVGFRFKISYKEKAKKGLLVTTTQKRQMVIYYTSQLPHKDWSPGNATKANYTERGVKNNI